MNLKVMMLLGVSVAAVAAAADETVWLDELSIEGMTCGYGTPKQNKSVEGKALRIGTKTFERAVRRRRPGDFVRRRRGD